ncbi:MAG: tRNA (adenosine(37)-N6)-threonylcarbamoyltransferase complex transferase subunit TsaD [Spirochaetota bacterium]|jgi:N6-L-threonylcarbamoyladenine synthase|nr:tRNA (adenosine(37)-N6)-threonylcarbamoyltransferase complex transferase subunit TsaD [Spirochaetota bacterium]
MVILGIETSCDDTAAAVVCDGREILSGVITSQDAFHSAFSGVVPEIASRRHLEVIHLVIEKALRDAGIQPPDLDRVAVTNRPGLIGSLLVGVSAAKACALAWDTPLVAVNHLAAHLYGAAFQEPAPSYPHLGLIISGGHSLLVEAASPLDVTIYGSTIDDAVGEVYDKLAKHFGLGYPGGPVIDRLAAQGDPEAYAFPRTLLDTERQRYHFSFSGLKTAVIHQRHLFRRAGQNDERIEDIAASFQAAAADILIEKARRLIHDRALPELVVSGGVAANGYLRERFSACGDFRAYFPPRALCTDNAAMVAGVAYHARDTLTRDAMLSLEAHSRVVIRGPRQQQASGSALL